MKPAIYFERYEDYFWEYEARESVLFMPNSYTIAYFDFIIEVLEKIAPQGLPRFGTLLLALAATNQEGEKALSTIRYDYTAYNYSATQEEYDDAFAFLRLLTQLPSGYRTGNNRIVVLQAIFQGSHNLLSPSKSEDIVEACMHNDFQPFEAPPKRFADKFAKGKGIQKKDHSYKDIKPFYLLSRQFKTTEAILAEIAKLPTIEPEKIEKIPIYTKEAVPVEDLVGELMNDMMTYRIGNLVPYISGGVSLLLKNTQASQQPLGGVMDISNKGNLDQLLLTEFANEDIVFLSRLANSEALYINREVAKEENNKVKIILIDVSLRNWGTIKTLAYAIGVAIGQHPKNNTECQFYAVGNRCQRIDLNSIDGVIQAIQVLDASLDGSNGLQYFLEQKTWRDAELFWVGTVGAIHNTNLMRVLHQYHQPIDFWVHPTVEGEIALYKQAGGAKKQVQSFIVPYEQLWEKQPTRKESKDRSFTRQDDYPILFVHSHSYRNVLICREVQLIVTKQKTILQRYDSEQPANKKGWDMICADLPSPYTNIALGVSTNNTPIMLFINSHKKEFILYNTITGEKKRNDLLNWDNGSNTRGFFFYDNAFRFLSFFQYWTINLDGVVSVEKGVPDYLREAAKSHTKPHTDLIRVLKRSQYQILRNVHNVYINTDGELILNKHRLFLNRGNVFKLEPSTNKRVSIDSETHPNYFIFGDGSQVKVDRCGMFILESSNAAIPTIYIPAVLDRALGLGTEQHFAGNMYFYKDAKCDVLLVTAGPKKIEAIKAIRKHTGLGLKDCKSIIDEPRVFWRNCTREKALQLRKDIDKIGGKVVLVNQDEDTLTNISTSQFNRDYLLPFIRHIIDNN